MIFQELNRIGQTFIVDPFNYLPADLHPREEIIAPDKVTQLVASSASDWEDHHTVGWGGAEYTMQRCWVSWNPDFTERISGVCYYALAESPELFWSLADVYPDSAHSVYEWLTTYMRHYFLMTTPLLMYHGDTSDIIYTVNCGIATVARPIHYGGTLDQMLAANAFAIGNGLTLALAMERAGRWKSSAVYQALLRCWEDGGGHGLGAAPSHVPPAFINFYVQSALPHITNYPALYASAGPKPCGASVRRFLVEIDGLVDNPVPYLQYAYQSMEVCQVTTPAAASMPYLRMSAGSSAVAARTIGTPQYAMFNPLPYYTNDLPALRAQMFLDMPEADGDDGDDDDDGDGDGDGDGGDGGHAPPPPPPIVGTFFAGGSPPPAGATAAPPREDFYVSDVAGLIMSVASQNSSWAWWKSAGNAEDLVRRIALVGFGTISDAMDYAARRLFALHEANFCGRRGRLRAMFKTWMLALDPDGDLFFSWFVKYVFGRDLHLKMRGVAHGSATAFGQPRSSAWNPPVPLTFMHDMFAHFGARFPLYSERIIGITTDRKDAVAQVFGAHGDDAPGPDGPRSGDVLSISELPENSNKRYKLRVSVSLYRTLKRYAAGTPEAQFLRDIDARVVGRLVGLRRAIAAAPPAHAIVADLVADYWRRNRAELAMPT